MCFLGILVPAATVQLQLVEVFEGLSVPRLVSPQLVEAEGRPHSLGSARGFEPGRFSLCLSKYFHYNSSWAECQRDNQLICLC